MEFVVARAPIVRQFYWKYAPAFYRSLLQRRIQSQFDFVAPLDPLATVNVDPASITRISGRKGAKEDRWKSVGVIREGEWDRKPPERPELPDYLRQIVAAETIDQTVLYQSIKHHIVEGVPWAETELLSRIRRGLAEGYTPYRSNSEQEAMRRCRDIDRLHERIVNNGYLSKLDLVRKHGLTRDRVGYLDVYADEITVDIGRDGEMLFVDGIHRMCIVKVLELDAVPVSVLVRHREWLDKRDELFHAGELDPPGV